MKAKPEWERPEIDFGKFQRQGLYSESQADGFSETESGSVEPQIFQDEETYVEPEPRPEKSDSPAMWDLVIQSLQEVIAVAKQRDEFGQNKYGTRLQAFNGRRALVDAFQESLDQTVYLQQEIHERQFIDKVVDAAIEWAERDGLRIKTSRGLLELELRPLFSAVEELQRARGKRNG